MIALNEKLNYQVTTASRVRIGSKTIESVQDRWIELKLADRNEKNLLFEYTLLDQTMEGNALIHQWAEDMEWVQSPLLFLTDLQGRFVGMQGLQQLKERWDGEYREKLRRKYAKTSGVEALLAETDALLNDKVRLVKNFTGYSHYRGLFQQVNELYPGTTTTNLTIPNYFGVSDLPLSIEQVVKEGEQNFSIKKVGILDKDNFDAKPFIRMLKDATNTFNLKVDLQVDMEEEARIENGSIKTADLFLECYVPHFYQITSAHQIKQIYPDGKAEHTNSLNKHSTINYKLV